MCHADAWRSDSSGYRGLLLWPQGLMGRPATVQALTYVASVYRYCRCNSAPCRYKCGSAALRASPSLYSSPVRSSQLRLFGLLVTNTFIVTLAGYTCAFALFALSINIMLGRLEQVPLGKCVFFGIGSYRVGIGMVKFGLSFEMSIVIAMLVSLAAAA